MCAKQKGFIKLKGSLGGLTFYQSGGDDVVKTTGGPSREKILNDPAHKRTRENMREFGAAAQVAKAFRLGFVLFLKTMADRYIVSRLTGLMKRVATNGTGRRGERAFNILANKDTIKGFEFNKNLPLGSIFFAPFSSVVSATRGKVTLTIPDFNTDSFLNPPEGATHFSLALAIGSISNYAYVNPGLGYEPTNPEHNGKGATAISAEIPLSGAVGSSTILEADLGNAVVFPNTVAVPVALGVVFYQEINGEFYELAAGNAMQVIDVV